MKRGTFKKRLFAGISKAPKVERPRRPRRRRRRGVCFDPDPWADEEFERLYRLYRPWEKF